jgi:LysM repeat protein
MRPRAYLLLILAVGLAACGGGGDSPSPSAPDVSPTPSLPTAPAASQTVQPQVTPDPAASPAPSGTTYVVRRGDTMTGIAKHFKVSLAALRAANPDVTNPRLLQIGHKLVIPTE